MSDDLWRLLEGLWRPLKTSRDFCRHLESSGGLLETSGDLKYYYFQSFNVLFHDLFSVCHRDTLKACSIIGDKKQLQSI